jgi:hypothetical protein
MENIHCTAFEGSTCIASGDLIEVTLKAREAIGRNGSSPVLIFDDQTGHQIDLDLRESTDDLKNRLASVEPRRAGRPRLGVVAREVTLLPRHWEWLNSQPGGASVALRKLVEQARRDYAERDRVRQAQEAAYKFMSAMAGNEPGFEEASRALFARRQDGFEEMSAVWPADVRDHARRLAAPVFEKQNPVAAAPASDSSV